MPLPAAEDRRPALPAERRADGSGGGAASATRSRSSATRSRPSPCTTGSSTSSRRSRSSKCDLVFNVCETFADDYRMEVNVAALMEMARREVHRLGHRGPAARAGQDPHQAAARVPRGAHARTSPPSTARPSRPTGMLRFPLIVKPARSRTRRSASASTRWCRDWDELTERVREIRKELQDEALAEEFIEGREVYVGVVGTPTRPRFSRSSSSTSATGTRASRRSPTAR